MGTLRAGKAGGYAGDGVVKIARQRYFCEVCHGIIEKGQPYERHYGCPIHVGAYFRHGPECQPVPNPVLQLTREPHRHV